MAVIAAARYMPVLVLFFGVTLGGAMGFEGDQRTENLAGEHTHARRLMDVVPKIVGGESAPEGRFSYMCSLKDNHRKHMCGAVLINPNWVLTAAHCVHPGEQRSVTLNALVTIGAHKRTDDENTPGVEVIKPDKIMVHDKYEPGKATSGWDIALIRLAKPSELTPILLPYSNSTPPREVLTLGWGSHSRILQQLYLEIKSNEECKSFYGALDPHIICASNKEGDICEGDSGGPLLISDSPDRNITAGKPEFDTLVGLTSFGSKHCPNFTQPGGYTLVEPYLKWINDVIEGPGSPCSAPDQISTSMPSTTRPQPHPSPLTPPPREPQLPPPSYLTPVWKVRRLDPGAIIFKVIVKGKYQCQGVLVDAQWIATSAHCVKYLKRPVKIARIGDLSSEILNGEAFIHPKSSLAGVNDVAMIKLTKRQDGILLPELPESNFYFVEDQHLTTLIYDSGQEKIHSLDIKKMHIDQCDYHTVRNDSICAGTKHTSLCLRDTSGAPLLQAQSNGRQLYIGILYWGPDCVGASSVIPLLYQPVSSVVAWMKQMIDTK